jgi:hypothetical protein
VLGFLAGRTAAGNQRFAALDGQLRERPTSAPLTGELLGDGHDQPPVLQTLPVERALLVRRQV